MPRWYSGVIPLGSGAKIEKASMKKNHQLPSKTCAFGKNNAKKSPFRQESAPKVGKPQKQTTKNMFGGDARFWDVYLPLRRCERGTGDGTAVLGCHLLNRLGGLWAMVVPGCCTLGRPATRDGAPEKDRMGLVWANQALKRTAMTAFTGRVVDLPLTSATSAGASCVCE